jgi:rhomboid protease GluP
MDSNTQPNAFKTGKTTLVLIGINVGIYLIVALQSGNIVHPSGRALVQWGANFAPLTLGHLEVWRLLTSMFLHGSLMHLAVNMYSLYQVGVATEFLCGTRKFLGVYFICGLAASAASLAYNTMRARPAISIGASGAVFAVFGFFLILMWLRTDLILPTARRQILQSGAVFIGFNLFFGLASSGIDNAAHIGGLLTGLLAGLLLAPTVRPPHRQVQF